MRNIWLIYAQNPLPWTGRGSEVSLPDCSGNVPVNLQNQAISLIDRDDECNRDISAPG